jgi:hypothetical protein
MDLFVSILVLLEVPLQHDITAPIVVDSDGFNPCFTGSTTSTIPAFNRDNVSQIVSILVLLEVPLQQHFLLLDCNNNTFGQFLQPLKLKFFTAN